MVFCFNVYGVCVFFCKLKTAYELRISDWSSDVCSSDLYDGTELGELQHGFNAMSSGLAERERIRDLFNRHVGEQVAAAASSLDQVEMGGRSEERRVGRVCQCV